MPQPRLPRQPYQKMLRQPAEELEPTAEILKPIVKQPKPTSLPSSLTAAKKSNPSLKAQPEQQPSSTSSSPSPNADPTIGSLTSPQALIRHLQIQQCDLLLVGDGSGSKWGQAIGWACTAHWLDRGKWASKVFHGASNNGTVNIAELLAYLVPLAWYVAYTAQRRQQGLDEFRCHRIHIVTDSAYAANTGNTHELYKKNIALWSAFDFYHRLGYRVTWHHLGRELSTLNSAVDDISRKARVNYTAHGPVPAAPKSKGENKV